MWAAISWIIVQPQGVTLLGNINPRLYELGNFQWSISEFHDIIGRQSTTTAALRVTLRNPASIWSPDGAARHCFEPLPKVVDQVRQ
jgi:hypothetical protein